MNDKMNTEYGLGNREFFGEDRQRILYDQLRSWAQRKNELKKQNAAINAEFRDVCNYALLNGIELTKYRLPEGKFIMKERHSPVTKELLLKHCEGLVSEEILQQLFDRIKAREVRRYQVFQQQRKNRMFTEEE